MDYKREVSRFLMYYDFPTKLNGYHYLKECLVNILQENIIESNKLLFADIAQKFNTDADNVERCLLTISDKMWKRMSYSGIFSSRPTVREFVMKCAETIMNDTSRPKSAYDVLSVPDNKFLP